LQELGTGGRAGLILVIFYDSVVTVSIHKMVISTQLYGLIECAAVENAGREQ